MPYLPPEGHPAGTQCLAPTYDKGLARGPQNGHVIRFLLNVLWLIFGSGSCSPSGTHRRDASASSWWSRSRSASPRSGSPTTHCGRSAGRWSPDPTTGAISTVANIIWVVLAGWWLALAHISAGIAQAVTIIGIPFAIANFKLVPAAFWPLGRRVAPLP